MVALGSTKHSASVSFEVASSPPCVDMIEPRPKIVVLNLLVGWAVLLVLLVLAVLLAWACN